jgi:hypothetical protein
MSKKLYKTNNNTQIQGAQCEWVNSSADEVSKYYQ